MTKQAPHDPDHYGFPGDEGTDPDVIAGGVLLVRTDAGSAYFIPRSVSRLTGEAAEAVAHLQRLAMQLAELAEQRDESIAAARDAGASWAAIGWSIGTTGEAARVRFGS